MWSAVLLLVVASVLPTVAEQGAAVLEGHSSWVSHVRMSPDLSRIATGSADGTVRVWRRDDAGGYTAEAVLAGHDNGNGVPAAWSADSQQLVTGDDAGNLRVYDASDWSAPRTTIDVGGRKVRSVSVRTSDGLVLAGCGDGGIRVVDVSTGRVEHTLTGVHKKHVLGLNWSPAGTHFASGDWDGKAVIWSASTWAPVHWAPVHELRGHDGVISGSMRWSPDSSRVLTACRDDKVRIFSASTGALERTMEGSGMGDQNDADWSPNGALVASVGDDEVVRVWDARTGALVQSLAGEKGWIRGVDWTRGDVIVSAGNAVRVWNVSDLSVTVRQAKADAERQLAERQAKADAIPCMPPVASAVLATAAAVAIGVLMTAAAVTSLPSLAKRRTSHDMNALQAELDAERQAKEEAERQCDAERQAKDEAERQRDAERQAKDAVLRDLELARRQLRAPLSTIRTRFIRSPDLPPSLPSASHALSLAAALGPRLAMSRDRLTSLLAIEPDGVLGRGCDGIAFRATLTHDREFGIPLHGIPVVAKVMLNLDEQLDSRAVPHADSLWREFKATCALPPHDNTITILYSGAYRPSDAVIATVDESIRDLVTREPTAEEISTARIRGLPNPRGRVPRMTTVALVERFDCDLGRFLFAERTGIRKLAWPDGGRTPWLLIISLLRDCLSALVHLRRFGRVHHDLKPDNVLVSRSPPTITSPITVTYPGDEAASALPRAVVADFGHLVRVPDAEGAPRAVPELDLEAVVASADAPAAAALGREYAALVDAAFEWTCAPHNGVAGNAGHLSPEVAASFNRFPGPDARRPYHKQGAYEAGILLHELLTPSGRFSAPSPLLSFADCAVHASTAEARSDVEAVCQTAFAMVDADPSLRLPLEAGYCVVEWAWAREVVRQIRD